MKGKSLLSGINYSCNADVNSLEIKDICLNSGDVRPDCLFAAMAGKKQDGKAFAAQAEGRGACAVLTDKPIEGISVPQIIVGDVRAAYAAVCGNFFGNPASKLKIVGVTGTNGKSTVAYLVQELACACSIRCGLIGTMYVHDGEKRTPAALTTPDPYELNSILSSFVKSGCKAAAMEVSAHALYWRKTENILFDLGVFTNLTQDHLDFFGDMQSYARAKASFFTPEHIRKAVINSDDPFGVKLINSSRVPVITYGLYNPADVFAVNITQGERCRYVVNDRDCLMEINSRLLGAFNVSNTLAAIACVRELGADCEQIAAAAENIAPPEGRFNVYKRGEITYIIDFAHTPDGLRNVLIQARKLCKGNLILVFGCGGDRDRSKRSVMGAIAGQLADKMIITEDNPRTERREDIAAQILQGTSKEAAVINDRRQAIAYACRIARGGDAVVIAGKGSENYIESFGVKTPYSDREQLLKVIGQ